jgi:hypothetical protein
MVSEIRGIFTDCGSPEEPRPHVSWICPACGRWTDTDLELDDRPPMRLECEFFRCHNKMHTITWLPFVIRSQE